MHTVYEHYSQFLVKHAIYFFSKGGVDHCSYKCYTCNSLADITYKIELLFKAARCYSLKTCLGDIFTL